MRLKITAVCVLFLLITFVSCSERPAGPELVITPNDTTPAPVDNPVVLRTPAQLTAPELSVLNSCNRFGLNLFREIVAATPATENVFISPLSVSYALGLCYAGADGDTREAIGTTLEMADLSLIELNQAYHDLTEILVAADPVVDFRVANSFWSRQGKAIQPDFIDLAQTYFDARVEGIDFQQPWAADTINAWVENATNGKIEDMVKSPIDPNVEAMLFNAIYFKGDWMFPFDTADTRDADFHLADGSETQCRMMWKDQVDCQMVSPDNPDLLVTDTNILYYTDPDVMVMSMPYGAGDFRMSIVIPNRQHGYPHNDPDRSIDDIIDIMTPEKWALWTSGGSAGRFDLYLPKFRFEIETSLSEVLQVLGMEIAFDPGRADFGNLFVDGLGWISEVKQKAFIQVDEKGTEAAAVTQVIWVTSLPPELVCDRPFLIVIHEDVSGAILFMGRIADPVWED